MRGKAIPHPVGNPAASPDEERDFRRRLVSQAVELLRTRVEGPTVFGD